MHLSVAFGNMDRMKHPEDIPARRSTDGESLPTDIVMLAAHVVADAYALDYFTGLAMVHAFNPEKVDY